MIVDLSCHSLDRTDVKNQEETKRMIVASWEPYSRSRRNVTHNRIDLPITDYRWMQSSDHAVKEQEHESSEHLLVVVEDQSRWFFISSSRTHNTTHQFLPWGWRWQMTCSVWCFVLCQNRFVAKRTCGRTCDTPSSTPPLQKWRHHKVPEEGVSPLPDLVLFLMMILHQRLP